MPYPFKPEEPTEIVDTGRLLPEAAYRLIGSNLSTGNVDKDVLLANARMMYVKLCEAEGKLMQANRKIGTYQKQFNAWAQAMRKLRESGTFES